MRVAVPAELLLRHLEGIHAAVAHQDLLILDPLHNVADIADELSELSWGQPELAEKRAELFYHVF